MKIIENKYAAGWEHPVGGVVVLAVNESRRSAFFALKSPEKPCQSFEHGEIVGSEYNAAHGRNRDDSLVDRRSAKNGARAVEAFGKVDMVSVAVRTVDRHEERISLAAADEGHNRVEAVTKYQFSAVQL
ncbi:MAG: hypothetical protein IIZ12_04445 [Eggerthellaceae bacterium]|nr:hypothetical protein [Eggerthellaceae bacterium]